MRDAILKKSIGAFYKTPPQMLSTAGNSGGANVVCLNKNPLRLIF